MGQVGASYAVAGATPSRLPWLSPLAICLLAAALCTPYLLVAIPPQVDVPGHIGAAAIEAAAPASPLRQYYDWQWTLNLNAGGEVLMKLLGGGIAAAWWTNLIATASLLAGAMLTFRALNPRGNYGVTWALVFVFAFPWIWGFTNFVLAAGISLIALGAVSNMDQRPVVRAGVLVLAQPIALMCHAIGGLILPLAVAATTLGATLDRKSDVAIPIRSAATSSVLPLAATPLVLALWKWAGAAANSADLRWDWSGKLGFLIEVLRDQCFVLDVATAIAAYLLLLFGTLLGARWSWRQGWPALAVLLLYAVMPAGINGSEAVDTRLLSIALLLALGLQDWSRAQPSVARAIAASGALVLLARMALIFSSLVTYSGEYDHQLRALEKIRHGSRVFAVVRHGCSEVEWRLSRLDMLPALATATRSAWVNVNWTLPGLHMAHSRIGTAALPSPFVWDRSCSESAGHNLATALPKIPLNNMDYVWLLDTGPPTAPPGQLVWQWKRSYLYRVGPPERR